MSTGKTLSNGTLSLKFMQNALRSQQKKEVHLEKAEVKDDGRWEVSQAVRDVWGLSSDSSATDADVHEESYMPFLFGSESAAESGGQPRGRRTFGKKGEEIVKTTPEAAPLVPTVQPPTESKDSSKGRKPHPRPISISSSGASGLLRGFDQLQKPTKSAREAIFESGAVGTDLRAARPSKMSPSHTDDTKTFMKPAGVDEPTTLGRPLASHASKDVPGGAGDKKVKRKRQSNPEGDDRPKKQKKDKKSLT